MKLHGARPFFILVTSTAVLFFSSGCGKPSNPFTPADFPSEFAAAIAGGASGSGSLAMNEARPHSRYAGLFNFINPFSSAVA